MQELLIHTLHDTIPMVPLLFLTYLILEYAERKETLLMQRRLLSIKRFGPLCGALLGMIPQCGISVIAAGLYVERSVSLGTLIAVFIATSDEALPILFAHPSHVSLFLSVIAVKLILAIFTGYLMDTIFADSKQRPENKDCLSSACNHKHYDALWKTALLRTVKIFSFLFCISFVLTAFIHEIGEEQLRALLLEQSFFQPFIAALVGFIPNCTASVILTQLFLNGILSFGSFIAGLSTNAGLGLMVLFKSHRDKADIGRILMILFLSAWSCGTLLQLMIG